MGCSASKAVDPDTEPSEAEVNGSVASDLKIRIQNSDGKLTYSELEDEKTIVLDEEPAFYVLGVGAAASEGLKKVRTSSIMRSLL